MGESKKPNIVLILIDDLGLTDLQAFGGEIDTPNMDALANEGMMFTNYHTTSECAPSRAMLLTGMDNHNTWLPMIPEVLPWKYHDTPGYEGYLRDDALTIAEMLKPAGYKTYMTGKWHLAFGGRETAALPTIVVLIKHSFWMLLVAIILITTHICLIIWNRLGLKTDKKQNCPKISIPVNSL